MTILKQPYLEALSVKNIVAGFEAAGVCPFNANRILKCPALLSSLVNSGSSSNVKMDEDTESEAGIQEEKKIENIATASESATDVNTRNNINIKDMSREELIRYAKQKEIQNEKLNDKIKLLLDECHPASNNPVFGKY